MEHKKFDDCCGIDKGQMAKSLAQGSVAAALKNPGGVENKEKSDTARNPINQRFLTRP